MCKKMVFRLALLVLLTPFLASSPRSRHQIERSTKPLIKATGNVIIKSGGKTIIESSSKPATKSKKDGTQLGTSKTGKTGGKKPRNVAVPPKKTNEVNVFDGMDLPSLSTFSSGDSFFVGKIITMANVENKHGSTLEAHEAVVIQGATVNREGVIKAGNSFLTGTWAVRGTVRLDIHGRVFEPYAMVRGKLAGSIPGARLVSLDMRGLDFGKTVLDNAVFAYCDLTGAQLEKARVKHADFSYAIGLTDQQKKSLKKHGALVDRAPGGQAEQTSLDEQLLHAVMYDAPGLFVKILLDLGANVNVQGEGGVTALMLASANGNRALVQMLLQAHADVELIAHDGENAISKALSNGHQDVAELLRSRGLKPVFQQRHVV